MNKNFLNWRDSENYIYLDNYNSDEFAWEFLRRNKSYQDEYNKKKTSNVSAVKWGLEFPGRSGNEYKRTGFVLVVLSG
ncbi:DUF6499 domain-containing protein [uncultured Bartonella sp.]|uniref:transcriptional regulator domain-containing protein n=1 Tax=uncultured Bartonella sp. TaxID=104108 RepID=UPI00342815A2